MSLKRTMDTYVNPNLRSGISSAFSGALGLFSKSDEDKTVPERSGLDRFTHHQLLQIGDYIQDIFKNQDVLSPPNIVTIGSQSSGKTSTINATMGLDILPTGQEIVTRTPLHIRMIHSDKISVTEVYFYDYHNPTKVIAKFTASQPDAQLCELEAIRSQISKLTDEYAGSGKNVVNKPISMKIVGPNVPNLSITDLPGITNIALTDKGQPEDIKQQIEKMLVEYIKNPRAIILSIIPSTIDVESDNGLGLIKKYDPEFSRTIGVITKPDMVRESDLNRFLEGNISINLQLGYGYFIVKNRSSKEAEAYTVREGYDLEKEYFESHEVYSNSSCPERMGILNLGSTLSDILIKHLRECLPTVIEEMKQIENSTDAQLNEIGRDYPTDDSSKRSVLNIVIANFQRSYHSSVHDRGAVYNTGAKLASSYLKFKKELDKLTPFSKDVYTDEMITQLIKDYEGNHMPTSTISAGVLEKCFKDIDNVDPISSIREPYIILIKDIQTVLTELMDKILDKDRYSRFPKLCMKIKNIMSSHIIPRYYDDTCCKINDLFVMERECIWTDDMKFRLETLPTLFSGENKDIDPEIIRKVMMGYFENVCDVMKNNIHKTIQVFFVNRVVEDINSILMEKIVLESDINVILEENKDKAVKRRRLLDLKSKIEQTKKAIIEI